MSNSANQALKEETIELCKSLIRIPSVNYGEGRGDEIEIANTKHNFFSHHVWNEAMLRVVDKKIKQEEEEIESIKKLVNSLL